MATPNVPATRKSDPLYVIIAWEGVTSFAKWAADAGAREWAMKTIAELANHLKEGAFDRIDGLFDPLPSNPDDLKTLLAVAACDMDLEDLNRQALHIQTMLSRIGLSANLYPISPEAYAEVRAKLGCPVPVPSAPPSTAPTAVLTLAVGVLAGAAAAYWSRNG